MLALLQDDEAARVLERLGLDSARVRQRLETSGRRGRPRGASGELAYTSHAKQLVEAASREARAQGRTIDADHLLLAALLEPRGTMGRLLSEAEVDASQVRREFGGDASAEAAGPARRAERSGNAGVGRRSTSREMAAGHAPPTAAPHGIKPRRPPIPWRLLMLLAVPISMVLGFVVHAPAIWVFLTACFGVLPLAGYMGEATEHLAHRTGPTVGGLLNATFGNAAELIIAIVALKAGLVELVKASITGSILGNLLLILGLAFIAGGTKRAELRFNRTSAGMSAGMLALAVTALVFPALFHAVHPEASARLSELHLSEAVAVILVATYGCSLLFTLKTHRSLLAGEPHPMAESVWSPGKAVAVLAAATVGVAIESELLVHAATSTSEALGLSGIFLGLIVIPIIGNAAEHAAAIVLTRKGQTDLGLQIALGSSTQVALLVAPILVFAGVLMGQDMNLVFTPFEVMSLGLATILISIITLDGESHWFEGVQLLAVYGMVGVAAFFLG